MRLSLRAARVPSGLLLRRFELRWFYREALRSFLAPETVAKRKHGFGLPFGVWMASHQRLRDLAYDSLDALKRRGFLRAEYLTGLVERHRSEHADYYGVMIWVLMMLEQWMAARNH